MNDKERKYEFTGETIQFEGHILRRIQYLRKIGYGYAYAGELGGWIESEHNLSHEGKCCVLDDAKVFGNAVVKGDAMVMDDAIVKDNALVTSETNVSSEAIIGGDTFLIGRNSVRGKAKVFFYQKPSNGSEEDRRKTNIIGPCDIYGNTVIEATGFICNCTIKNKEYSGYLNFENEIL